MNKELAHEVIASLLTDIARFEEQIKDRRESIALIQALLDRSDRVVPTLYPDDDYATIAYKVLELNGKPMHIEELVSDIRLVKRNPTLPRYTIEATFFSHIRSVKNRKLKRVPGPSGERGYWDREPQYGVNNA